MNSRALGLSFLFELRKIFAIRLLFMDRRPNELILLLL